jgi:signal peptidase I
LRELLGRGVSVRLRARGGSMRPFVRSGSWIWVDPPDGAPRAGDVLAVERGGRILTHRVVEVTAAGVRLRGDAMRAEDGVFAPDEVLGRVRQPGALRWLGRAWAALHPWPLVARRWVSVIAR